MFCIILHSLSICIFFFLLISTYVIHDYITYFPLLCMTKRGRNKYLFRGSLVAFELEGEVDTLLRYIIIELVFYI